MLSQREIKLSLGSIELTFVMAPMVPLAGGYDGVQSQQTKVLFSADGFGKFGALDTGGDWT